MAIFNQQPSAKKDTPTFAAEPAPVPARETPPVVDYAAPAAPAHRANERSSEAKESLIASDITIEKDAKLNGGVRAKKVTVAGELEGNIDAAAQVELQQSGVLIGDLKAGSLTVAAGSRMRGQAEFGWDDKDKSAAKSRNGAESGAAA
jgi:hypothetical protein